MRILAAVLLTTCATSAVAEERFGAIAGERVEFRESSDAVFWDVTGWYGGDLHKAMLKTEGERGNGETLEAELQLLYSRAWTAFFDLQFGVRQQDFNPGSLTSAVIGVQGDARYGFEIDAAAFISEDGDVSVRAEFEKDFLLTERWILQPRVELLIALQDVPELEISSGIADVDVGLRVRYEITRKLAPYVGLSYSRHFGDFEEEDTTAVAGLRFWF